MKKMMSVLLSLTILFAAAGKVSAQTGDKNITFVPAKNHAAYVSFVTENSYSNDSNAGSIFKKTSTTAKAEKASLKAVKANSKALKNFGTLYKENAAGANWSISKDVMVATFSKDDVKTNVVYNGRGSWVHTLTYYPDDKTPAEVASAIDYSYPKDVIKLTIKVEEGNMQFYIVQLENKTTFKKVTLYNGDVNQIEELTKGN